ncbi:tetratricopeptide repeat protein [Glycomyces luteolus]|uniref:Tetratricopeptide repeat protein n=1 Tax=Glycomyces luteolus TaxID=2670330 RepID=A0A9X3SSE7_9ACTN|nr:tetratricopeptide repeat protein [Glycomyces luteolus]MDA1362847.1 tetratricopeptide repeat protein [Glycomyces luteolus]
MTDDDLIGVHGKETTGPRWAPFRDLNNTAARLFTEGRTTEAAAMFEEAYRLTLVDDLDAAGFDARARVLGNLSSLAEARGDTGEALRLAEEALFACDSAEHGAGDRYGTVAVRTNVLIQRAQTYQLLGRFDDALTDLDAALELIDETDAGHNNRLLAFTLHNTRTVQLIRLERLDEADAAARHSLELATAHDPRLAGHPYSNLAMIAQAHNDHDAATAYLRLAEQIHTASGDPVAAALAIANQGRSAARQGDLDTAERLLATAEQAFLDGQQPLRAAEIRSSRAHVAFQNNEIDLARSLLPQAIETLREAGHVVMLAEALALLGDMLAADTGLEEAEHAYLEARALYEATGAPYQVARLDMRRSIAIADAFERETDPQEQQRLLLSALYLSLPSALATDAIRHQYAPGPAREQWAATVAIPAMAHALHLAMTVGDGALISELLEHMSATVSLHAPPQPAEFTAAEPFEFPVHDFEADQLSFAASAFITGSSTGFPAAHFALPPRLRVNPNRPSALELWIAETERRYGFPIRSDQVVDSW